MAAWVDNGLASNLVERTRDRTKHSGLTAFVRQISCDRPFQTELASGPYGHITDYHSEQFERSWALNYHVADDHSDKCDVLSKYLCAFQFSLYQS